MTVTYLDGDKETKEVLTDYGILIGSKITKLTSNKRVNVYQIDEMMIALKDEIASNIKTS